MAADHPWRLAWKEFAERNGHTCYRELNRYYNAGFIGLKQIQKSILSLWQKLLETCEAEGYINLCDFTFPRGYPHFITDQCVLNLAVMLTPNPLSTFGPEGMDFGKPSSIMSYAAGAAIKPWRKQMIRKALGGVAPSSTDKLYWQHTQIPIQLYSRSQFFWKKLSLNCGATIGRFIHRAPASA
jgi:hypothetical protein